MIEVPEGGSFKEIVAFVIDVADFNEPDNLGKRKVTGRGATSLEMGPYLPVGGGRGDTLNLESGW